MPNLTYIRAEWNLMRDANELQAKKIRDLMGEVSMYKDFYFNLMEGAKIDADTISIHKSNVVRLSNANRELLRELEEARSRIIALETALENAPDYTCGRVKSFDDLVK